MQNGQTKRIFNKELLSITIDRLCYQLIENHNDFKGTVIIGIQNEIRRRGKHQCTRG